METSSATASRFGGLTVRGRILLQSAVQLAGRGASGLGALVLLWLITRYLGPSTFGTYTFVAAYVSLLFVVTDLGSQSIAVRDMARRPAEATAIAGQLLTLKLGMAAATFVCAVIVALFVPLAPFRATGAIPAVALAAIAVFAVPLTATGGAVFQTRLRMTVPAAADALSRVVTVALVAAIVVATRNGAASAATRLALVMAAGSLGPLAGAVLTFAGARRIADLRPRYDRDLMGPLVRDAVPLAIVFVLGIIHYRVDVLVLTLMRGMTDVGEYGVATKLLDVTLAGAAVFMGLAFPVLSRRLGEDRALLQRAFEKTFDFMLILGLGAAVFVAGLAPLIVRVLAGSHFRGAAVPLAVIAWAIPISFVNSVFAHMVVAANLQRLAVPVSLAAIALNVALNVALIPHLGPTAPALVTDITEGAGTLGIAVIMMRHYRFGPSVQSTARIVLAAAVAAAALWLLQPASIFLAAPVAAAAYPTVLLITGAVSLADLRATVRGAETS